MTDEPDVQRDANEDFRGDGDKEDEEACRAPNLPAPSLEVTHIAQTYPEAEENEFTAEPFILQRKAEKCPLLFGKPAGR